MGGFTRFFGILATALVLSSSAVAAPAPGSLEGRWLLVEQRYGKGEADHASTDQPVRLEFVRDGGTVAGTIRAGSGESVAARWPAMVVDGEPQEIRVEEYRTGRDSEWVRASYTVPPRPGDDLMLKVVEEYRVSTGGKELVGTVTVSFMRDGEPRGSYVLHRRFERQP
jgi:hypothetical protein